MTTKPSSQTMSRSDLRQAVDLIEVKPGLNFSLGMLKSMLPDVETALFFGKVYELDYVQLSQVLAQVLNTELAEALFTGDHSTELQDYIIDITDVVPGVEAGSVSFQPDVPKGEVLPELWKSLEVQVAQSLKDVAAKLQNVVGLMPGKQGNMLFKNMAKMNLRRPTIGSYQAHIHHAPAPDNLVILDVSGSMTERTIRTILDDVVALSYMANAHMAVVSNTTTHWEPGTYGVDDVLRHCEFGGTYYETLTEVLSHTWGTVITIADYDSAGSAKTHLANNVTGSVQQVLDISLVNRPTFLSECVGQFAQEVQPLLIAPGYYPLSN